MAIVLALAVAPATARARVPAGPALVSVPVALPAGEGAPPFEVPRRLLLPRGWRAQVWARVSGARFAAWAPDGSLLVSVPAAGEVVRLEPRRDGGAPPRSQVLLSGLSSPEGLGFDVLDGHPVLYVAESDQLDRYAWAGLRRTVLVRHLPDADGLDRLKGLAVGADHTVYLGVGSDSSRPGPRGVVLAVGAGGRWLIAARGVHYAEGLAADPRGQLWAAINSAGGGDDEVASLRTGHPSRPRLLPPHTAPLGLTFLAGGSLPPPWGRGALLAVHGALDPAAASRPGVLWLPWDGTGLGTPEVLVSGFQEGRVRWGRPTDALAGPDGSLYVVDDLAGAIYRLVPAPRRHQVDPGSAAAGCGRGRHG